MVFVHIDEITEQVRVAQDVLEPVETIIRREEVREPPSLRILPEYPWRTARPHHGVNLFEGRPVRA